MQASGAGSKNKAQGARGRSRCRGRHVCEAFFVELEQVNTQVVVNADSAGKWGRKGEVARGRSKYRGRRVCEAFFVELEHVNMQVVVNANSAGKREGRGHRVGGVGCGR